MNKDALLAAARAAENWDIVKYPNAWYRWYCAGEGTIGNNAGTYEDLTVLRKALIDYACPCVAAASVLTVTPFLVIDEFLETQWRRYSESSVDYRRAYACYTNGRFEVARVFRQKAEQIQ